jgi:hypothetical protein
MQSRTTYYHRSSEDIVKYIKGNEINTLSLPYIMSSIRTLDGVFNIATTHMIDTEAGKEDAVQIEIMSSMLKKLKREAEHLICGDFNIPRGYNNLYAEVTKDYTDNIPEEYKSSLDINRHRLGYKGVADHIFTDYLVDYIFTKNLT